MIRQYIAGCHQLQHTKHLPSKHQQVLNFNPSSIIAIYSLDSELDPENIVHISVGETIINFRLKSVVPLWLIITMCSAMMIVPRG